jgi:L-aminopeptidase/D-esterase-like protein
VVATNAALSKTGCFLVAQSAHDGLARSIEPAHTTVDGDAVVAASVGKVDAPLDHVRLLAARAVARAVLSTVVV